MRNENLSFADAVTVLDRGGVLILPTDTLPGLHCRADCQETVLRIAAMKGRDDGKPLLVLAGSFDQARSVCSPLTPPQERFCQACWPGPFSLILPAGTLLAGRVTAGDGTVAVRVPDHAELQRLIFAAGFPLVSTSVNFQGLAPATDLEEACTLFGGLVDGCWQPRQEPAVRPVPSALVDLTGDHPRLIREGPVPLPDAG